MSLMPNITYQIDNSIKIDSNFIVAIISLVVRRPLHETAPLLEAYHQTEKKQRMAMK